MNKKIFAGIGLSIIAAIVIFVNVERQSDEEKRIAAITQFMIEQTDPSYTPLEFIAVTNEMLLEDVQLKSQLEVVRDTLKESLRYLTAKRNLKAEAEAFTTNLQPDEIDEFLKFNAKLSRMLPKDKSLDNVLAKQSQALDLIANKLSVLNLSPYSIDLSGKKSAHYLHRFSYDGFEQLHVFEVDVETNKIVSFKEIG